MNLITKLLNLLQINTMQRPILVNSIPKSGTNLLKNIMLSVPSIKFSGISVPLANESTDGLTCLNYLQQNIKVFFPGKVYDSHIPYYEEVDHWLKIHQVKQVFIYRDPRDITVSLYHYIMRDKQPRHAYYDMYLSFETDHNRLLKAIIGHGEGKEKFKASNNSIPAISHVFDAYYGWIERSTEKNSNVLAIRYEDLISSEESCTAEIRKILDFLLPHYQQNKSIIREIQLNGMEPSKSHTFRKGKIGSWKQEYTQEHIEAFQRVFDDKLLHKLGYNWR